MFPSLSQLVSRLLRQRQQPDVAAPTPDQPEPEPLDPLIADALDAMTATLADAVAAMPPRPEEPAGYRTNARGDLVRLENIRKADLASDAFATHLALKGVLINALLAAFRRESLAAIEQHVIDTGNRYGVDLGGKKGNVQITTHDGKYRVQRAHKDLTGFTTEVQAAKALIDRCMRRWTAAGNPNAERLIDSYFRTDKRGDLRTAPLLELLRAEISDEPDWQEAMRALRDAIEVTGSAVYVRVYERGPNGKYEPVPLDLANA